MSNQHHYSLTLKWTGNKGSGTSAYTAYERSHIVSVANKPDLLCSSDASFRGDKTKYNPEELLVASLSSCHMLWYLHLCSEAGIVVTEYTDNAKGTMTVSADGSLREMQPKALQDYILFYLRESLHLMNTIGQAYLVQILYDFFRMQYMLKSLNLYCLSIVMLRRNYVGCSYTHL